MPCQSGNVLIVLHRCLDSAWIDPLATHILHHLETGLQTSYSVHFDSNREHARFSNNYIDSWWESWSSDTTNVCYYSRRFYKYCTPGNWCISGFEDLFNLFLVHNFDVHGHSGADHDGISTFLDRDKRRALYSKLVGCSSWGFQRWTPHRLGEDRGDWNWKIYCRWRW